ncbi:MAG: hypothetical protein KatS3mg102_0421 [Planctomycetota bacterium]|nr:MAG: hypothetical protein KatS3mg102_0421 [Planctomycetota bacterium]
MSEPEAVLLEIARPIDAVAVGAALQQALGLGSHDARLRARACGGIVLERAEPAVAEACLAALQARGIGARRLLARAVPVLGAERRVAAVALQSEGAALVPARGAPVVLPWSEVELVLAWALPGARPARSPAHAGAGGTPSGLTRQALRLGEDCPLDAASARLADALAQLRRREQRRIEVGIDLVHAGTAWRLECARLFWERAGPPHGHSAARLLALLRQIAERTAPAAHPPETRALLAGLAEVALFFRPEELRRYARWLLAGR